MSALTQADFAALQSLKDQNNRIGYWSYLRDKGDAYAGLALGVVTNETREGYIANNFLLAKAQQAGLNWGEAKIHEVGLKLMQADFAERKVNFDKFVPDGGLTVSVEQIARYHDVVFRNASGNILDGKAWTAELPLRDALAEGAPGADGGRGAGAGRWPRGDGAS